MFWVQPRPTVKLLLVVILMTNIQGIFGVTVGNGNVFTGDVRGNLPQGNGMYTKANGIKYTGYFEDGKMSGDFMVDYGDGDVYRGDVDKDGIREGKGVYTWPDGSSYEGEWRDGDYHGQGVKTWSDGVRYEGEWRDGKRTGQGIYYFASGDKYVGEWRDGKRTGQGIYYFASGDKYVGEWRDGKRTGQGIYYFASGDKYVGEFKEGKKNDWGRYTYKNNIKFVEYDGERIDDDFTGYGKMIYKDDSIYNGQWNSSKREGEGLLLWPNGTCFYGQMKNDKIYHSMTMTPDLVITYPPYKNTTYDGKGFKVVNFTGGEIDCFNEDGFESCYNNPNDTDTLFFGSPEHYYFGDTITVRKRKIIRKIMDGFGELGLDGGYYIGEMKQGMQTGFGLKSKPFSATMIGTFKDGIMEGTGVFISFSSKHRTVYIGGHKKGQPDGPGMFIYPNGEKVLGYFIEGKLDHSKNPIYLHSDGTRDSLVPTSG